MGEIIAMLAGVIPREMEVLRSRQAAQASKGNSKVGRRRQLNGIVRFHLSGIGGSGRDELEFFDTESQAVVQVCGNGAVRCHGTFRQLHQPNLIDARSRGLNRADERRATAKIRRRSRDRQRRDFHLI
jgi:hypothetical protein